jgi:hypothetical protein
MPFETFKGPMELWWDLYIVLDTIYPIKNNARNGYWIHGKIHPIVVAKRQSKQG